MLDLQARHHVIACRFTAVDLAEQEFGSTVDSNWCIWREWMLEVNPIFAESINAHGIRWLVAQ